MAGRTIAMPAGLSTYQPERQRVLLRQARMTKWLGIAIAFALLFAGWWLLAINIRPWVPTPVETFGAMVKTLNSAEFYEDMLLTWQRLLLAFVASTLLGTVLGIAVGLNRKAEAFFQPLLALALAVPDPVIIIFAILAVGTGELAGFIALTLAITPFVANIVRTSVQARDTTLDEMVKIYRIDARTAFRANLVPQLVPALITAARLSFALSWKIVILVEALCQPQGIGAEIYHSFSVLKMRDAFAVAILFTVMMQVVERVVLYQVERRLLRWRD